MSLWIRLCNHTYNRSRPVSTRSGLHLISWFCSSYSQRPAQLDALSSVSTVREAAVTQGHETQNVGTCAMQAFNLTGLCKEQKSSRSDSALWLCHGRRTWGLGIDVQI